VGAEKEEKEETQRFDPHLLTAKSDE